MRHVKSHDINATSPATTQRVSHTFSTGQHDCLTLKMEATKPFEHPELLRIPQELNLQHAKETPLREPSSFLTARPHYLKEHLGSSWKEVPYIRCLRIFLKICLESSSYFNT